MYGSHSFARHVTILVVILIVDALNQYSHCVQARFVAFRDGSLFLAPACRRCFFRLADGALLCLLYS